MNKGGDVSRKLDLSAPASLIRRALSATILMLSLAGALLAQTFTGSITGAVLDPAGAVIPDARVTLTNTATGETREVKSNSEGRFTFAQLQPSIYTLKVTQSGFRDYLRTGLQLLANQTLEANVSMAAGLASETVEISAAAQMLDTQTANQSVTLQERDVRELPVVARNPFALFHTQAGAVAPRTGVSGSTTDQNHNRFSINGGRDESVRILIDGIPVVTGDWGGLIASPGVDAVSEFQISRNVYDAQYGRTAGRFTKATQEGIPATLFPVGAETSRNSFNPRWTVSIGNTFTISPTFIVNLQLGGGKWTESNLSKGLGFDASSLGLPASLAQQFDIDTPPSFNLADYVRIGENRQSVAARSTYSVQINASKQLTKHSLKFGYSLEHYLLGLTETLSANFSFNRFFSAGPDPDVRGSITSGNTIASFLLGAGTAGNAPRNASNYSDQAYHSWYIQDAWNVSSRLTVNLGLRYEIQKARTERYDRLNWFDFDAASPLAQTANLANLKGGLRFVSDDDPFQWDTPYTDFAPRIGISYKLTDKIVARAGYGLYYQPTVNVGPIGNNGFSIDNTWVASLDSGRTVANPLRNPFPNGLVEPTGSGAGLATAVGTNITTFQRERPTPYVQQYSVDVQYEIGRSTLLELAYSGTQGRKLSFGYNDFYAGFNINQIPDSALALGSALRQQVANPFFGVITAGPLAAQTVERRQLLRPYPQFLNVSILDMPGASSSFNALVARMSKRFSEGLSFSVSYQFSKALDNASENQGWEVNDRARNFYNLAAERSVSAHDVPHSLAVTYVYELPVGRNRKFGKDWHPAVDAVVGGWQMNAIYKYDSGLPLLFQAPDNVFSYSSWQFPNLKPGVALKLDNPTVDRWFNTDAFEQPANFTYGNAPRFVDEIRYSHVNNWDLALAKNFRPWEQTRIQFRAEMFNAFNRVQFGRANSTFGNTAFGRVTGTAPGNGPRTIQMALRVEF